MENSYRVERDRFGDVQIDINSYYGVHTKRALENFPISNYKLDKEFIIAYAEVKEACTETNMQLGYIDKERGGAILVACREIINGDLHDFIVVDPLQGGAGTSTNMNINEVIANRASVILGKSLGDYFVHPLNHVNMHQSTNDTYPTALIVAIQRKLLKLEKVLTGLQDSLQKKEKEFQDIVKLGRTELQDAVPITLGISFGAFADAIARDRWRVFKSKERIKIVPLGGTALGTGIGAPREYIFKVVSILKQNTGLVISRGENLVDSIQNLDPFVEVSAILKAYASTLMKLANDLRFLSSGPYGGIGEITLPALQAGSSIMPNKVNPIIPEAAVQVALKVISNDQLISLVAGMGNLELNHLFPLLSFSILESLNILISITEKMDKSCISGVVANREICEKRVKETPSIATILVHIIGYKKVEEIIEKAVSSGRTVYDIVVDENILPKEELDEILSPWNMYKLGFTK
ncbi:aspartate ammonia-lyase [bacterium]|nr:aspartate ammonia-lyase [bacterium]